MVEVVGRRQMDDVDRVVVEQLLERVVHRREPLRGRALGRRADYAGDLDAEQAKRVNVHHTDEPRADDSGAERRERPCAVRR